MSVLESVGWAKEWRPRPLGRCFHRSKRVGAPELQPLSVFLGAGVVPRSERTDNHNELGANLGQYLVAEPDDLVFNKLRTWQGGFGRSAHRGIVSPAYFVCRPMPSVCSPFVDYLLHSSPYLAELARISKWQPPSQFDTPWDQLTRLPLYCPGVAEQRSIVEFLNRECERFSRLSASIERFIARVNEPVLELAKREFDEHHLGRIGYRFEVQLGKMLDEKRVDRADTRPYLRNANVHWDDIRVDDVKQMTFDTDDRRRFALRAGDLLVCEGGEPGRAAVWGGELEDCYYQKALHRVRPYATDSTRYLLWALRVLSSRNAFAVDGPGRYTHLTAEMLRAVRVPMPTPDVQHERAAQIDEAAGGARALANTSRALMHTLTEYRDALITEAVTGQLDVAAMSDRQMDERLVEAVEPPTA